MQFYEQMDEVFEHFTKTGGFLTVKSKDAVNTMTISWGFVGFLWAKPHFAVVVRPQRFTRGLIDAADDFTVSVPFGTMREQLSVCGTKSGRDVDKGEIVTFVPSRKTNSPVVAGCDAYFECRIKYFDDLRGEKMPADILQNMYNDDLHRYYFGEIVERYGKEGVL